MNVVKRRPILSVKMPETGDKKNVVPMVNDPTKAIEITKQAKEKKRKKRK